MDIFKTKVESLGGVYKRYARSLEKLGIINLEDFLFYPPYRYDDFSLISKITNVEEGQIVTIRGNVLSIKNTYTRRFKTIQTAIIGDDSGKIEVVWFNQPYLAKNMKEGDKISISGKVLNNGLKLSIQSPEYEITDENYIHTGRLVPIYPETRGISSKWIRRQIWKLLSNELKEYLPDEILKKYRLPEINTALFKVHFPNNMEEAAEGRRRFSLEEFLIIQTRAKIIKKQWEEKTQGNKFEIEKYKKDLNRLIKSLPFKLTNAQLKAIEQISGDLNLQKPMNRLLEGDVGSGKTIVAALAAYLAFLNGYKTVLMAPTEILAIQHFETFKKFVEPFGLNLALATGSKKINLDNFDILIGTHAVLSERIKSEKIGLIIVDEQQRFGVLQRGTARQKGKNPHLLTMTATPIPRTVALTIYGNLDLSILDEIPKGKKEIKTWLVPNHKREAAYQWIKKQIIKEKAQAFIICPFIEESESATSIKAATKEFDRLTKEVFPDLGIKLLHGKMKIKEKDQVLDEFRKHNFDILVATPVVEVGIDIPDASIIVIEAAERFGLAQLHQLRGRVGRRGQQAYCLLFSESKTAGERLKYMEKTQVGSLLAEYDLKIRGAGKIFGTAQHGRLALKFANFADLQLIAETKKTANEIADKIDKYPLFKKKILEENMSQIFPD